jgi:hypothetical protein
MYVCTTNLILPIVLYEYDNYSLALSEDHRLIVLANRMLRITAGPKKDDTAGGWR